MTRNLSYRSQQFCMHSGVGVKFINSKEFCIFGIKYGQDGKKDGSKNSGNHNPEGKKYAHEGFKIIKFFRAGLLNISNIFAGRFLKNNLDNLILIVQE